VLFNKEQKDKIRIMFRTEVGKSLLSDLKEIIVKADNYPVNATDGVLFAVLMGRAEGELSVIRQLIKIGESND
jgi:hypothetical protein